VEASQPIGLGKSRIEALSDGVFSIAMTLLVLELKLPDLPAGAPGLLEGNARQLLIQFYGVVVTLVWSGVVTFGLLKLIALIVPLRVSQRSEIEGLDITQHGEALQ